MTLHRNPGFRTLITWRLLRIVCPGVLRGSLCLLLVLFAVGMSGCGSSLQPSTASSTSAVANVAHGAVHGGQQPVSGATIQIYEAGAGGYFAAARPMLSPVVVSDGSGNFSITQSYTCTAGNQVYLIASGGNPGLASGTSNSALALMAPIGSCTYLLNNRNNIFLNVDEVTTVAGAWTLSRFMASPTNAGTSSGNAIGLANAFAAVSEVVNISSGVAPGPALPPGATLPVAEINTLANILASCVNSDGSLQSGSPCSQLFSAATLPAGVAPTDTLTAALNIARDPTANVSTLYALVGSSAPFQPSLSTAPNNWMIGIHFVGGGLSQPAALAVDNTGNIWTANPGNNSVSEFTSLGAPLSSAAGYTGGGLAGPGGVAIDSAGNAWVANAQGSTVTKISPLGAAYASYAAGLNQPSAIAIDGSGNVFVSSKADSTVAELSNTGSVLLMTPSGVAGVTQPSALAVNAH